MLKRNNEHEKGKDPQKNIINNNGSIARADKACSAIHSLLQNVYSMNMTLQQPKLFFCNKHPKLLRHGCSSRERERGPDTLTL